ncbi:energy transducer TonB [Massilia sp. B-10]|nr:energy transducer TonB [Massilia sp. B-10]
MIEADVINERIPCKPNYPQASIRNSEVGTVKLQLLVNVNGYISRAKVVETSGFHDLDRAAMVGFMGCKFKPP